MRHKTAFHLAPLIMILASFTAWADAAPQATPKREVAIGYLKWGTNGKTVFLRRPGAIEPVVEVKFASPQADSLGCRLESWKQPYSCPIQRISFIPIRKEGSLTMASARLIGDADAWHRLKVKEDLFKKIIPAEKN